MKRHTFKAPAKPVAPPTPRASLLGLDKLAAEKRAAVRRSEDENSRKRPRTDEMDESDAPFKGEDINLALI